MTQSRCNSGTFLIFAAKSIDEGGEKEKENEMINVKCEDNQVHKNNNKTFLTFYR